MAETMTPERCRERLRGLAQRYSDVQREECKLLCDIKGIAERLQLFDEEAICFQVFVSEKLETWRIPFDGPQKLIRHRSPDVIT